MKKIKILFLSMLLTLSFLPSSALALDVAVAVKTKSEIYLNQTKIELSAYNIGGNNYFKLRDIACALKETNKEFEVFWNDQKNAIMLTSGAKYTKVGGEMLQTETNTDKTAVLSKSKFFLNDIEINLKAYSINNNNYFKLRDIMELFNIYVEYLSDSDKINIITSKNYLPEKEITPQNNLLSTQEIAKLANSVVKLKTYNKKGLLLNSGSGYIVSNDGKIVTNYHVIENATFVDIIFNDETVLPVKWALYTNKDRDIAILQVESNKSFPALTLGNSDALALGEPLVVISSPQGIMNSISTGIYSRLLTPDLRSKTGSDFQMTAPISPGSSGGAVFDYNGEVVAMVYANLEEGQNLNLSIPINEVKEALTKTKKVSFIEFNKFETPKQSLWDISVFLTDKFRSFTLAGSTIKNDYVYVYESELNANLICVDTSISDFSSNFYISALHGHPWWQRDLEAVCKTIINTISNYYPNKDILGAITLTYTSATKPLEEYDMLYFDKEKKLWIMNDDVLIFKKQNDDIKFIIDKKMGT